MRSNDSSSVLTDWNRRRFLGALGLAGLGLVLPRGLFANPDDFTTISILHTTDLHGHLVPTRTYEGVEDVGGLIRCASQIARWRRQNPNSLLVDCGDVYQGTEAGFRTHGEIMTRCFNQMRYDAWVPGNHEFDWGIDPVRTAVGASAMPVLSANVLIEGKSPDAFSSPGDPMENIAPYLLKEIAGFKIGIIGITTPDMTYWFPDEFLKGFEAVDPIEPTRRAIRELKARNADAIVIAGHMGLRRGNFANRTYELIEAFHGDVHGFLGGHTHRLVPAETVDGVQFSQPSYHGIHVGRFDLVFKNASRQLVNVHPTAVMMDASIPSDPEIASLTADDLARSEEVMAEPAGELGEELSIERDRQSPSELEWLIGSSIAEAMAKAGTPVDAVFHGLIFPDGNVAAGPKTVADIWGILPYENYIVTAEFHRDQLAAILEENFRRSDYRSIMGLDFDTSGRVAEMKISNIRRAGSQEPLRANEKVRVAFNAFDSQSAGQRLMVLREALGRSGANRKLHPLQTRETIIAFFRDHDVVRKSDLTLAGKRAASASARWSAHDVAMAA